MTQSDKKVIFLYFNSQAGGMAVARPYGFEIDFVRNFISGSAAWFFLIILKFIFTPIFEIKIHEKNSLIPKKTFHYWWPIFIYKDSLFSYKTQVVYIVRRAFDSIWVVNTGHFEILSLFSVVQALLWNFFIYLFILPWRSKK